MKRVFILAGLLGLAAIAVWAAYTVNPYTSGMDAGTPVVYGTQRLTFLESNLKHPEHTDGLVNMGDTVYIGAPTTGGLVGVAVQSATAATNLITVDLDGIWNVSVERCQSVPIGAKLYINKVDGDVTSSTASGAFSNMVPFGYAVSAGAAQHSSQTIAVKVMPN